MEAVTKKLVIPVVNTIGLILGLISSILSLIMGSSLAYLIFVSVLIFAILLFVYFILKDKDLQQHPWLRRFAFFLLWIMTVVSLLTTTSIFLNWPLKLKSLIEYVRKESELTPEGGFVVTRSLSYVDFTSWAAVVDSAGTSSSWVYFERISKTRKTDEKGEVFRNLVGTDGDSLVFTSMSNPESAAITAAEGIRGPTAQTFNVEVPLQDLRPGESTIIRYRFGERNAYDKSGTLFYSFIYPTEDFTVLMKLPDGLRFKSLHAKELLRDLPIAKATPCTSAAVLLNGNKLCYWHSDRTYPAKEVQVLFDYELEERN
jgi:hypothetical protein